MGYPLGNVLLPQLANLQQKELQHDKWLIHATSREWLVLVHFPDPAHTHSRIQCIVRTGLHSVPSVRLWFIDFHSLQQRKYECWCQPHQWFSLQTHLPFLVIARNWTTTWPNYATGKSSYSMKKTGMHLYREVNASTLHVDINTLQRNPKHVATESEHVHVSFSMCLLRM